MTSKGKEAALKELSSHLRGQQLSYISSVIQFRQKLGYARNVATDLALR
ncbi:hypothetical protein GGR08_001535 [Bartonella fuyuanensis]|uniref:Uncharacterized protein n=1 Tax=Bartonella fuyuanensis TaxID=1460968 RepID=A0A840E516_9HYPH|nr:hypothetical protein [Bartonella fuyuanensis]